jgi:hypothetical protein
MFAVELPEYAANFWYYKIKADHVLMGVNGEQSPLAAHHLCQPPIVLLKI